MSSSEGAHGFDFLHGEWSVGSRGLVKRLVGCTEWQEFPGTAVCRPFFEGAGSGSARRRRRDGRRVARRAGRAGRRA